MNLSKPLISKTSPTVPESEVRAPSLQRLGDQQYDAKASAADVGEPCHVEDHGAVAVVDHGLKSVLEFAGVGAVNTVLG
jgi:hypothetical protein